MTAHQFNSAVERLMRSRRLRPKPKVVPLSHEKSARLTITRICNALGLPVDDVLSQIKTQEIVFARYIIAHRLYEEWPNYLAIGRAVGKHHATVMYQCKQYDTLVEIKNKKILAMLEKTKMI